MPLKLKVGNYEEYKVDDIQNSTVYVRESATGQLLGHYNLVL